MHAFLSLLLAVGLCALTGCAKDPSKEAPSATVGAVKEGPSKQEGSNTTSSQSVSLDGRVGFVGSKVTASHDGLFKDWKGTATLGKTLEDSSVSFTVQVASVVSDPDDRGAFSAKLDGHLKSGEFFDVANHPTAGFTSTQIAKSGTAGGSHSITGDLTIRGVTRSVTFPATLEKTKTSLKAKAQFTINRKDWGIMYAGMADDLIRDGVVLKLDLQGTLTP
jgi:polyisoprenoid-binding protein YceI